MTLLVGRQEGHPACTKLEWWGTGMVVCLKRDADRHMAQLMPLTLTVSCFSKIQIGFTFLVLLTRVVLDKGPLNGCVCECTIVSYDCLRILILNSSLCTIFTIQYHTSIYNACMVSRSAESETRAVTRGKNGELQF